MRDDDCKRYLYYHKKLPPGSNLIQCIRCFNALVADGAVEKGSPVDKMFKNALKFRRDEKFKDFNLD